MVTKVVCWAAVHVGAEKAEARAAAWVAVQMAEERAESMVVELEAATGVGSAVVASTDLEAAPPLW